MTVFAITLVANLSQVPFPVILTSLQRTPAIRDGELWRLFTSLLVQDGGWVGTISNLTFLLLVGAVAERVLTRWLWLACYLGGGLTGQFVGLAWQPIGGGNSIAICGLAGALAVVLLRGGAAPPWTPAVVAWWCGALAGTISFAAAVVGIAAAVATQVAGIAGGEAGRGNRTVGRVVGVAVLAFAAVLIGLRNVHGPPLLVGAGITLAAGQWRGR
ncbi:MAG TPA: rhomboid family intramembrane serine protease [Aldersonia sp.]